LTKSKTV